MQDFFAFIFFGEILSDNMSWIILKSDVLSSQQTIALNDVVLSNYFDFDSTLEAYIYDFNWKKYPFNKLYDEITKIIEQYKLNENAIMVDWFVKQYRENDSLPYHTDTDAYQEPAAFSIVYFITDTIKPHGLHLLNKYHIGGPANSMIVIGNEIGHSVNNINNDRYVILVTFESMCP